MRGYCWTGSIASPEPNAWRCFLGNYIYDPCFSSPRTKGIVLCPADGGPWSATVLEMRLTRRLPERAANGPLDLSRALPWAMATTTGLRCVAVTGATVVIGGRAMLYDCNRGREGLWGRGNRRSRLWTFYVAPPRARHLHRTVEIRTAWF